MYTSDRPAAYTPGPNSLLHATSTSSVPTLSSIPQHPSHFTLTPLNELRTSTSSPTMRPIADMDGTQSVTTTRQPLGPTHLNTPPTSPELGRALPASGPGSVVGTYMNNGPGLGGIGVNGLGYRGVDVENTPMTMVKGGMIGVRISPSKGYRREPTPNFPGSAGKLRAVKSVPLLRQIPSAEPVQNTPNKGKGRAIVDDPSHQFQRQGAPTSGRKRSRTSGRLDHEGALEGRVIREKDSARSLARGEDDHGRAGPSSYGDGGGSGKSLTGSLRRKSSIQKLSSVMAAATAPLTYISNTSSSSGKGSSISGGGELTEEQRTAQGKTIHAHRPLRKMPSSMAALTSAKGSGISLHAFTPVASVKSQTDLRHPSSVRPDHALDGQSSNSNSNQGERSDAEETAALDPRLVFQKERFLNRHSKDFGHLYKSAGVGAEVLDKSAAAHVQQDRYAAVDLDEAAGELCNEWAETESARQQRLLDEARAIGREKRRSWMLGKAGIGSTSTATTPAHHRRNSSILLSGLRSPVLSTTQDTHIAPSASVPSGFTSPIQSVHPNRQTILSGGPRPLSLVASRHRQLSSLTGKAMEEVVLGPVLASPIPETINENNTDQEEDAPRPSFNSDRSAMSASSTGTSDLGHRRRVSTSRYPRHLSCRGMSMGGSAPPTAYQDHAFLTASPSGSSQPSAIQASLPPHLRNLSFSSAHSSSSLSSLGHVIAGGSPASSSCSSGGSHLGGPPELPIEALNFRMSIVERPLSVSDGTRAESRTTNYSSIFSTVRDNTVHGSSLRTESRLTMLADDRPSPISDTFGEEIIHGDDRGSRAVRRRARAFLVSGLKLEQGSRPSSSIMIEQGCDEEQDAIYIRRDPGRRAGIIMEGPVNLERPPSAESTGAPTPSVSAHGQRKRYSVIRRERTGTGLETFFSRPAFTQSDQVSPMDLASESSLITHENSSSSIGRGELSAPPPGITFALFENADRGLSSPVAVSIPATPPPQSVSTAASGICGSPESVGSSPALALDTLNSFDLARDLFWKPGSSSVSAARQASLRKAKSDIGLGQAFKESPPTVPSSVGNVREDSAGASPGRTRKNSWSGGVRDWWRTPTEAQEDKAEKGFGLGRGEDHHPTSPATQAVMASATAQTLKEKKSWKPFSVGRRKRKGSLPDSLPLTAVPTFEQTPELETDSPRFRRSTEPGTICIAATSPDLLTPPEPVYAQRTIGQRYSLTSMSHLPLQDLQSPIMMYPGKPYGTHSPLLDSENRAFRNTRSRTPDAAAAAMYSVALNTQPARPTGNRNSWSETHLPLHPAPSVPAIRKLQSSGAINETASHKRNDGGSGQASRHHGPLAGLGMHVEWSDMPSVRNGTGKAIATDSPEFEAQASTLIRLAHAAGSPGSPLRPEFGKMSHRPVPGMKPSFTARGVGMETSDDHLLRVSSTSSSLTRVLTDQLSTTHRVATLVDAEGSPVEKVEDWPATHGRSGAKEPRSDCPALGVYVAPLSNAAGTILPAKLFFFMGFIFGPWVWLMGGWALSPAGRYSQGATMHKPNDQLVRDMRRRRDHSPKRPGRSPRTDHDKTDKWVKRNRLAAVASSAIFIPAMCVGFAYVGKLL